MPKKRKHVLFLIHGMGVYANGVPVNQDNWFKTAIKALKTAYESYPDLAARRPFDSYFEVVPLLYDPIFHGILTRWQSESAKVRAVIAPGNPIGSLVNWLDNAADTEDNFIWSHLVDVALYRFVPTVRQAVKVRIAKQIAAGLEYDGEKGGVVREWSVVAHSLGTMVAHDALHAMHATTPKDAGVPILQAGIGPAKVVAMIANVSRLLQTDVDVYKKSRVVPPNILAEETVCHEYMSINNRFDPFTIPCPFDPGNDTGWQDAAENGTFDNIRVGHVHNVMNVHDIDHYLLNPEAHIPLLRTLVGDFLVTPDEEKSAVDKFRMSQPAALVKEVSDRLAATINNAAPNFINEEIVRMLGAFLRKGAV